MTTTDAKASMDLFDDYREEWRRGLPSCFDCLHIERPFPQRWQDPSRCLLLKRAVERALGHCSQFKPGHGKEWTSIGY